MSSTSTNTRFFWEQRQKGRSRFNLLLLEYGEYFFEDLSANLNESVQGRLKICSRSVIFEPIDQKRPVVKYPFKHFSSKIRMVEDSIVFDSACAFELKANNKISPYKQIGSIKFGSSSSVAPSGGGDQDSLLGNLGESTLSSFVNGGTGGVKETTATAAASSEPMRVTLHLLHSDTREIARKMEKIRSIHAEVEKRGTGSGAAEELLAPLIKTATSFSFDTSQLVDFHEKFLMKDAIMLKRIKPLITNPGLLMVTQARVYFQPAQLNNVGDTMQCIDLGKVSNLYRRRYLLRQTGLEFLMADGSSTLFAFDSRRERDRVYSILTSPDIKVPNAPYSPKKGVQNAHEGFQSGPSLEIVTRQWQRREISNFDYLLHLNIEADRSVNDLTQYPVFPHVLTDFESAKLDFEDPSIYRDLSKPMGALNPGRLKYFQKRYKTMPEEDEAMGIPPPFLYGTHYSTPGYVLYYLVRVAPEYMLCLQNGKFDSTDRMFHSMRETWESSLTNPTDLKELIPEFFCGSGDFLNNIDDLELGRRHTGDRLDSVELPPWAKRPQDFVRKMRKALESEHVSTHLHQWVDLVFGYKQKGPAAVEADNLYYYLTYEGSVDLEQEKDIRQRAALEAQIQEFGQTPKQLFAGAHPSRNDLDAPLMLVPSTSIDPTAATTTTGSGQDTSSNSNSYSNASASASGGGTNMNALSAAYNAGTDSPLPAIGGTSEGDDLEEGGGGDGEIRVLGEDFRQEVQHRLSNEPDGSSISPRSAAQGSGSKVDGAGDGTGASAGASGAGGEGEEVNSPTMRMASSIFGSIKGRTASYFEGFEKTGWFGSSSGKGGTEGTGAGNDGGNDSGGSQPKPERITSSNYKARVNRPAGEGAAAAVPRGSGHSSAATSTAGKSPSGASFRTLQQVDMSRLHEGPISGICLNHFPGEDSDSAGQWRLCSIGAGDGKLKVVRLGQNTLSITPLCEVTIPPASQETSLVHFSKGGDSVLTLSAGEASLACMTTFLLSSPSSSGGNKEEATCVCMASQPLATSTSTGEDTTLVTEVNVAGGAKGLIDFRATAADGTEKASKSFYILFGTEGGTVGIRSVSHSGVLGPQASNSFVFKPSLPGKVTSTALNSERVLLAIGLDTGALVVIDVESRKERYSYRSANAGESGAIKSVVWLQKDRVAFASQLGEVVVGDVSSSAIASSAFGFRNSNVTLKTGLRINSMVAPKAASLSLEDTLLFCGCGDGSIRALIIRGGEICEAGSFPNVHEGGVTNVTCDRDLLASSGADGTVCIWKII